MSNSPTQTPSFPPFIPINTPSSQSIGASSSKTNTQPASSSIESHSTSTSSQTPWANPRVVQIPTPLHGLPKHLDRWLPKFNRDDGLPAKEHLHNYMLSINLNGVVEEDCIVRLFPYTLQGSPSSWYFSLPPGSITNWDIFEEQFLGKFGDDRTTASLINIFLIEKLSQVKRSKISIPNLINF